MFLPEPTKIVVYRSEGERLADEFLYGGGMFEPGLMTPYIITDILLILFLVAVLLVGGSYLKRRR